VNAVPIQKVLFVCSQNKLRSPTAESVFAEHPELEVASAGLNHNAEIPLSLEMVEWADVIFVMEKTHRRRLSEKFRQHLKHQRVICLDIPDEYDYMDPELIRLLESKVRTHLRL
jgi:predicted protein tyrosine phosphatase